MTRFDDSIRKSRSVLIWGDEGPFPRAAQCVAGHLPLEHAPGPAQVLIAPATLLNRLRSTIWKPACALVVLTGPGRGYIHATDLDRFWRLFRVPCFERLCDSSGAVIAAECEAHNGLHLLESTAEVTDGILYAAGEPVASVAELREELCGCGPRVQKVFGIGPVDVPRAA